MQQTDNSVSIELDLHLSGQIWHQSVTEVLQKRRVESVCLHYG